MILMILIALSMSRAILAEPPGYRTYKDISSEMAKIARENPLRTYLYSIGKSVEGRDLWVIAIANSHPDSHLLLRPEIKFIGNMHGNELQIGEVLIRFINELVTNPDNDARITEILDTTRVHILVQMNPDTSRLVLQDNCTSLLGSNNSNNYDLNQNFPDKFFCQRDPMQPETLSVLSWLESQRFLLSARFFTGGMVTTYPYENFPGSEFAHKPKESLTEDDDVFKFLAKKYSLNHRFMALPTTVCDGNQWKDGIVNGANWWPPIRGGMEDVNYWKYGCYEITMEIGCCLLPPASELPKIWDDNRNALIEFARAANTGIRGIIRYQNGQPARYISIQFDNREPIFKTTELGEYYTILLPGIYNMTLMLNCDPIYSTMARIHQNGLLVFNITLDDQYYFRAFYYNLNKYATYCTRSKGPVDCSTGTERYEGPSGISTTLYSSPGLILIALITLYLSNFLRGN